jgi:hypothetical protein
MSGDSPQGLVSPSWAGATPAPFLQVRDLEAALRERDDALEERTRMLSRAKAAVEQLHGELERTRREADETKGQVRACACACVHSHRRGVDHGAHLADLCAPQARATLDAQAARITQLERALSVRVGGQRSRGGWGKGTYAGEGHLSPCEPPLLGPRWQRRRLRLLTRTLTRRART